MGILVSIKNTKMENGSSYKMVLGNCIEKCNSLGIIFDGVVTSPPYNLGHNPRHRKQDDVDRNMYSTSPFDDAKTSTEYISEIVKLFQQFHLCVKARGVVLWNMGMSTKNAVLPFLMIAAINEQTDWTIGDVIYWKKKTAMPFQTSPNKATPFVEPIYVFCRKGHVSDYEANKPLGKKNEKTNQQFYKPVSNIFEASNGKSTVYNKATFSQEMVSELLSRYFTPGMHILDPFAGSGTTLLAGKCLEISVTGIEIDQNQVNHFNNSND